MGNEQIAIRGDSIANAVQEPNRWSDAPSLNSQTTNSRCQQATADGGQADVHTALQSGEDRLHIAEAAYQLAQQRHFVGGSASEDWLQAERSLVKNSQSVGPGKITVIVHDQPMDIKTGTMSHYYQQRRLDDRVLDALYKPSSADYLTVVPISVAPAKISGEREIIAVGRLCKERWSSQAESALMVAEDWSRRGVEAQLMRSLMEISGKNRVDRVSVFIFPLNLPLQNVCSELGFLLNRDPSEQLIYANVRLR